MYDQTNNDEQNRLWLEINKQACRIKQLAFLTPCDQAFNPPFLGGKIIELAKFCFKNKRFEPSLSFFTKQVIVSHSFNSKFWNFAKKIRDEKMHIFGEHLHGKIPQFNPYF